MNASSDGSRPFGRTAQIGARRVHVRLYRIWTDMRIRCNNTRSKNYPWYGAKGIKIDPAWDDYADFRAWAIANGYRKDLTLDRIESDKDYGPNNCRWATRQEQQTNTSRTIQLTHNGVTRSLPEWSRLLGLSMDTLRVRHRKGWPHEYILTVPKGGHCPGIRLKPRGRAAQVRAPQQHKTLGDSE